MLSSSKLVAFVATANPEKSEQFYESVLGLKKIEASPYALVFEAKGTTLRIQKIDKVSPASHTVLGWEVADIVATVKNLASLGVNFERFEHLPQDDLGIWTTPDGSNVVWFKDPDGNTLSLTEIANSDSGGAPAAPKPLTHKRSTNQ